AVFLYLQRKYEDVTPVPGTLEATLGALREAIDENGGHVLSEPSFADIGAAVLLQGVVPVDQRTISLGEAARRVWTDPELARRYKDLIECRDAFYRENRAPF